MYLENSVDLDPDQIRSGSAVLSNRKNPGSAGLGQIQRSVFQVTCLIISGRVGTHIFFSGKNNFMDF